MTEYVPNRSALRKKGYRMNLSELKDQIINLWKQMSFSRRVYLGVLAIVVVTGLFVIYSRVHKIEYVTLYNGLEPDEAGTIIDKLKSSKIPYKIAEGGKSISVPEGEVEEIRLRFSREGLPRSGVGYEIFDKKTWGMTDFVEKVNYKRARKVSLSGQSRN